jgi:hypothetical protein
LTMGDVFQSVLVPSMLLHHQVALATSIKDVNTCVYCEMASKFDAYGVKCEPTVTAMGLHHPPIHPIVPADSSCPLPLCHA